MATQRNTTTQSVAAMSVAELQAKAAALRAARAAQGPQHSDTNLGLRTGVAVGQFINSFGVMKDAYQLTRAQRTGL